jgi:hypothetical protein
MSRSAALWAGVPMIIIGIVFLLRNVGGIEFNNWWALLMLLPAVFFFGRAYRFYQSKGSLTAPARTSIMVGLLIAATASVFLFNLNWAVVWPVFVILVGLGFLFNAVLSS